MKSQHKISLWKRLKAQTNTMLSRLLHRQLQKWSNSFSH